jgi:hypothetical protein
MWVTCMFESASPSIASSPSPHAAHADSALQSELVRLDLSKANWASPPRRHFHRSFPARLSNIKPLWIAANDDNMGFKGPLLLAAVYVLAFCGYPRSASTLFSRQRRKMRKMRGISRSRTMGHQLTKRSPSLEVLFTRPFLCARPLCAQCAGRRRVKSSARPSSSQATRFLRGHQCSTVVCWDIALLIYLLKGVCLLMG